MSRRRAPLQPCGVLISEIAKRACKKVQGFTWPIGPVAKKTTKLAESRVLPFLHAIECQWLAILSFADDQILAVETLDEEAEKFPAIVHRVPFMDWALICLITWLKFLISVLTHWGISSNNTNEKEVVIDIINSTNLTKESNSLFHRYDSSRDKPETSCEEQSCIEETKQRVLLPESDISEKETMSFQAQIKPGVERYSYAEVVEKGTKKTSEVSENKAAKPEVEKSSYWEVLMKGMKEKTEKEEDCLKKTYNSVGKREAVESRTKIKQDEEDESTESNIVAEDDPILELFATSWHKETWKKNQKKGNTGKTRVYKLTI
ncbi:hypothetical protein NMG60_11024744 [Bertholletia excelsa]